MSGGLVFAGFESAASASELFGVIRIATTFLDKVLHPETEEELLDMGKLAEQSQKLPSVYTFLIR
jgi:hypothetical protein